MTLSSTPAAPPPPPPNPKPGWFRSAPKTPQAALKSKIEELWKQAAYITNDARLKKMRQHLHEAENLNNAQNYADAFDAFYQAKREWIMARQKRQIYYWRSTSGMAMALCVALLCGALLLYIWLILKAQSPLEALLPLAAALGGGLGGCVAALLQVVDVEPRSEVVSKWLWFVIKPAVGAALGFITYFALISGLNLIADNIRIANFETGIVIGFLAGFIESFSQGILARVAAQLSQVDDPDQSAAGAGGAAPPAGETTPPEPTPEKPEGA